MRSMIMNIFVLILLYNISVESRTVCRKKTDCRDQTISDNKIVCISKRACSGSIITASDSIDCSVDYACDLAASLYAKNDINCPNTDSCAKISDITSTDGNVYCNGYLSCKGYRDGVPNINAVNVNCGGKEACYMTNINADNNVYLKGFRSARYADVTAGNEIIINAQHGATDAALLYAPTIYVNRSKGALCEYKCTKFITSFLKCIGEYSCSKAISIRSLTDTLYVEFNGDKAGTPSKVFCPSDGKCTISCMNGGCSSNTLIFYTDNSDITMVQSACNPQRAAKVRPDFCPMFRKQTSNQIMEIIQVIEAEEDTQNEYIDDDDDNDEFMAFIGMELQPEMKYKRNAYMTITVMIIAVILMIIGCIYYYNNDIGEKYESI